MKTPRFLLLLPLLLAASDGLRAQPDSVPGRWGTTNTAHPDSIKWFDQSNPYRFGEHQIYWVGERNLRAQWFKILTESPQAWQASGFVNHARGEAPGNTSFSGATIRRCLSGRDCLSKVIFRTRASSKQYRHSKRRRIISKLSQSVQSRDNDSFFAAAAPRFSFK